MGILPKLPVVRVSKKIKKKKRGKAIKRGDKSLKRLLITLAKIWGEESIIYLSKTIQDNLAKTTTGTLLLKFLIRSTLISPIVVIIKSISSPLLGLASI